MGDVTTITITSDEKNSNDTTLNSPVQIIIKKEDIGLEEYQHKTYQYSLFNNRTKRDRYYDDLTKIRDRFEKTLPTMHQVIHTDIGRMNTNKLYERQLKQVLNGPRGLTWQCKQRIKRLKSEERGVQRDLIRLNDDLTRISLSPSLDGFPSPGRSDDLSPSQISCLSSPVDIQPTFLLSQKTRLHLKRSLLINPSRTILHHSALITQKQSSANNHIHSCKERSSWLNKPLIPKVHDKHFHLQKHAHIIRQQQQIIEQKLKDFLH